MATPAPARKPAFDVLIVGGGVIGLSVAVAAVRAGLTVQVIEAALPGGASRVAAGLLAPSLGTLSEPASAAFRRAARDYPAFLKAVSAASGRTVAAEHGVLEIALLPQGVESLNRGRDRSAIRFSPQEVAARTSDLAAVSAAVLHPDDGWIEPAQLVDALAEAVPPGSILAGRVVRVDGTGSDAGVILDSGESFRAGHVVIAAGCWSPLIEGVSRIPVSPARGETLVIETAHALPHAVACEDFYLVPRRGEIVVGATFELVGYDATTTAGGRSRLEQFAARLIPGPLRRATAMRSWAGLRPMTPDRLPIIDFDPNKPRIIISTGHGKNGLLLAGFSAEIVVDLIAGNRQDAVFPFRLDRFTSS